MFYKGTMESPIGPIQIIAEDNYIIRVDFYQGGFDDCNQFLAKTFGEIQYAAGLNPEVLKTIVQLDEYFSGQRKSFDINVKLYGTEFYTRVWKNLCDIPYGKTISYKMLAERCGTPKGFRAVGQANHHNPISIVVPCHRVIGADKKLTGYGSGLNVKQFLLQIEQSHKEQ